MLTHFAVGPLADKSYVVAYLTPGCSILTVACPCITHAQAVDEAKRLNREQLRREHAMRDERRQCGLGGAYHGLAQS